MNDPLQTPPIPPPLPKLARSNLLGALACGVAGFSALVVGGAFYISREVSHYVEGFPPGTFSGGSAFSLNFYPLVVTFASLTIGLFACGLLVTSCCLARSNHHRLFSAVHICAGVFLLPFFILFFRFLSRFLQ